MLRRKIYYKFLSFTLFFCIAGLLGAQTLDALGGFTPYSMFGVGELAKQGTAFNRAMGGIGVGLRDHRYVNYMNPAAITARDSLAFMLDFGAEGQNTYLLDASTSSVFNTFNMRHLVLSFPLRGRTAMMLGLTPYSHTGYKFERKEHRPDIISEIGDIVYQHYGDGGISQALFGVAVPLFKYFSLGAQGIYYFGRMSRSSDLHFATPAYRSLQTGNNVVIGSFSGKFGLQYERQMKNNYSLSAGVSYLLPSDLTGDATRYAIAQGSSGRDTIYMETVNRAQMKIPAEFGVGFSLGKKQRSDDVVNKWMIGLDYTRQDWGRSAFAPTPGIDFKPVVSSSLRAGFEFTPDLYDPRYVYKQWTYRGGVYYEQTYMMLNNTRINASGITLGISFPVMHWANLLNFGVDLGQRGSVNNQLVRERYVVFQLGISLYDIWFRKFRYD
ncbi:MAG: hypothetical protein FWE99_06575 [Bacteroidales bacterium]|nr:hypothetical protein [Bacteroidales bacterium]